MGYRLQNIKHIKNVFAPTIKNCLYCLQYEVKYTLSQTYLQLTVLIIKKNIHHNSGAHVMCMCKNKNFQTSNTRTNERISTKVKVNDKNIGKSLTVG